MSPSTLHAASPAPTNEPLDALVRALERRDILSPRERATLIAAVGDVRTHPAGHVLIRADAPTEASTLLLDGLLSRQYYLPDGKRQIVAAHVSGDFVDLHGMLLKRLDHDVVAISDVRVALFPHAGLRRITEEEPHLARLLWLLTVIDAAVQREWTARLGQSAAVRVAQLVCELQLRLAIVGRAEEEGFVLGLTQTDIGDMTGLTGVHVNRTLRKLRESELVVVRAGTVTIPDPARLRAFAQFDPTYLYAERSPR